MNNVVEGEQISDVYICYYDIDQVNNRRKVHITDSKLEALVIDPNFTLISLEDITDAISVGIIFEGLIHIQEGVYQWYSNPDNEDDYGYKFVAENKKRFAS